MTGARKGLIADAGTDEEFATAVLQALEQQQDVRTKRAVNPSGSHAGVRRSSAVTARSRRTG